MAARGTDGRVTQEIVATKLRYGAVGIVITLRANFAGGGRPGTAHALIRLRAIVKILYVAGELSWSVEDDDVAGVATTPATLSIGLGLLVGGMEVLLKLPALGIMDACVDVVGTIVDFYSTHRGDDAVRTLALDIPAFKVRIDLAIDPLRDGVAVLGRITDTDPVDPRAPG